VNVGPSYLLIVAVAVAQRLVSCNPSDKVSLFAICQIVERDPVRSHASHEADYIEFARKVSRPLLYQRVKPLKTIVFLLAAAGEKFELQIL